MTQVQEDVVNLGNCDREPIHIPGRVQSHGVLLVLEEPDLIVLHASENTRQVLGVEVDSLIGQPLAQLLHEAGAAHVRDRLGKGSIEANPSYVGTLDIGQGRDSFHVIVHRFQRRLFLELEPASSGDDLSFGNLYSLVRTATGQLKGAASVADLCRITAEQIRRITGFDRVMIYQFDQDWNGIVLAEDKIEEWNSYFDLRFPASDIPKQARELYLLNRLRLISDVHSQPADLVPQTDPSSGAPIDLTYAALRSVSPIHITYLKNMGVGASMSISIVKDDRLWGLVACHHRTSKQLPFEVRAACEHLGEIVALQLSAKAYAEGADYRIELKAIQTRLLAHMAGSEDFVSGLVNNPADLLALTGAAGCAVLMKDQIHLVGQTPPISDVQKLIGWIRADYPKQDVFQTEGLPAIYPPAEEYRAAASGILCVCVSPFHSSYLVWFRPEIIRTVKWAGNPNKPVDFAPAAAATGDATQLHPRKSFETWKETVRGTSLPWKPEEIAAASDLRDALVGIILRKAEELAALNAELRRSNKELEAFSYSVSHDLRAPFRHIFGFSDLLQKRLAASLDDTSRRYIHTIMESASLAGNLVDSLLAFSQMGRQALKPRPVEMSSLVEELRVELADEAAGRQVEWRVGKLPIVTADVMMLKLAVRNLMSNALKYSRTRERSIIEIGSREENEEDVIWIRDNGVGFDMRFKDKLFGVFQRLHRMEEFEGTGIGLANVSRTMERHGGRVWADAKPDEGATFFFALPKGIKEHR